MMPRKLAIDRLTRRERARKIVLEHSERFAVFVELQRQAAAAWLDGQRTVWAPFRLRANASTDLLAVATYLWREYFKISGKRLRGVTPHDLALVLAEKWAVALRQVVGSIR